MAKEIKDYLHLYIGCEVIGVYDDEPRKGYLTGIHGEYQAEIQFFEEDGINVFEEPWYNEFSQVKPILRPFSDMTEDEMRELWLYIFDRPFHKTGTITVYDRGKKRERKLFWSGVERLCVGLDGDVWADSDLQRHDYNKHEVTRWFLLKHFDLFDLIESGLSINKTKINVPLPR